MTIHTAVDDRHEQRLERLAAADDPVPPMIEQVIRTQWWWPPYLNWRRIYSRVDANKRPYGTFVYRTEEAPHPMVLVHLSDDKPDDCSTRTCILPDQTFAWIHIVAFPGDPTLPGLAPLLVAPEEIEVVQYQPGDRCILRSTNSLGRVRFVKVFADNRGARMHADSVELWRAAQTEELNFAVAEPLDWDPEIRALSQHGVAGQPVREALLGVDGEDVAYRMGCAAASVTTSSLRPGCRFNGSAQMKRTDAYAKELVKRVPAANDPLLSLLLSIRKLHGTSKADRLLPIHGSPYAHHWLVHDDQFGLVDFARMGRGDPELDAGTFLAEMDFEDPDEVPTEALRGGFIEGYQSVAGRLSPELLLAYRLHKHLSNALKVAREVRPDGPRRVLAHLDHAKACLVANRS